ncbi:hypothetical protein B0H10DRAFT_1958048 [Mycena sp. CBHHK59/15]|nr:hypothetical protein B0H10DRAFT_1958048 [Mycena sp. CBHHK59/15]
MTDMFADDPWNVGMPKVTPEVGLPNEIAMLNNSGLLNDIIMHEGGTNNVIEPQLNVWASHREGQSDRSYPAREVADIAKERAKAAIREKHELEAMLAKPRQEMQGLDTQWRTHLEIFKGQVHHDFEQQRVRNYGYVKGQMQADLAREAEYQKNLVEIEENNRRQEDIRRREQEREKVDSRVFNRNPYLNDAPGGLQSEAGRLSCSLQLAERRAPAQDDHMSRSWALPDRLPDCADVARTLDGGGPTANSRAVQHFGGPAAYGLERPPSSATTQRHGRQLMTGKGGGGVKKSSPRKKKIGTASALVKARKEEQEKLKPEDDQRWKKITIKHWRLKTDSTALRTSMMTRGDQRNARTLEDGPTRTRTGAHSISGLKASRGSWPLRVPDVSDEYLKALFNNYLEEAHAEWSCHQPRAGESLEDTHERAEAYDAERRDKNNGTSRKNAANNFLTETHAAPQNNGEDAPRFRGKGLPGGCEAGMSSEEDEPAEVTCGNMGKVTTVHNIKIHPWRAQKVNDYVEMIDDTTEKCMMKLVNKCMQMRTGDKLRSGPPLQLPRALFDPAWLSKQKEFIPDIEEHLQISEKKFEMMEIEVANLN